MTKEAKGLQLEKDELDDIILSNVIVMQAGAVNKKLSVIVKIRKGTTKTFYSVTHNEIEVGRYYAAEYQLAIDRFNSIG